MRFFYPNLDDIMNEDNKDDMVMIDVDDGWSWTVNISNPIVKGRSTVVSNNVRKL